MPILSDSERNTVQLKQRPLQHHKVRNKIESTSIVTLACRDITMCFVDFLQHPKLA